MVSVPARRQQVAYGRERGLSARRACTLFSVARSALEYRSRKAAKDAPVVTRMKELSAQYPRYGYRRIRIFLDRDGHRMSPGRAHRLEGLVHQEHRRIMDEGAADAHPLAHSAGELVRITIFEPGQAYALKQAQAPLAIIRQRKLAAFHRKHHVVEGAAPVEQYRILENESDIGLRARDRVVVDSDLASARRNQACDHGEQGRFSASRSADQ